MSHYKLFLSIIFLLALTLPACTGKTQTGNRQDATDGGASIEAKYAKGFRVEQSPEGVQLLTISDPEKEKTEEFRFALIPRNSKAKAPEGYTEVRVPLERVICMTSLQLSNFIRLGLTDRVVGITSTRHLRNARMKEQLKSGATQKIGIEGNFDPEIIMALQPDAIFISPFKRGGYEVLRGTDSPLIPHLGYKELTPLGQAEWIKVVGLLTGNADKANKEFEAIENRYNSLKAMTDTVRNRPVVFSGEMRGGNWYAVGGKSFLAQMFRDAGADYFLKDNNESGGVTLDYETVYSNAENADYWRIVNSYEGEFSYDALRDLDNRYTDFKAWKNHGVIYCNMNDVPFYESMPVEPDVLLADFITVFHPGLLPDHKPVYYHLLK